MIQIFVLFMSASLVYDNFSFFFLSHKNLTL